MICNLQTTFTPVFQCLNTRFILEVTQSQCERWKCVGFPLNLTIFSALWGSLFFNDIPIGVSKKWCRTEVNAVFERGRHQWTPSILRLCIPSTYSNGTYPYPIDKNHQNGCFGWSSISSNASEQIISTKPVTHPLKDGLNSSSYCTKLGAQTSNLPNFAVLRSIPTIRGQSFWLTALFVYLYIALYRYLGCGKMR